MTSSGGVLAAFSARMAAPAMAPPVAPVLNSNPILRPGNRAWMVETASAAIMSVVGPLRSRNLKPRAVSPAAGAVSSMNGTCASSAAAEAG